MTDVFFLMDVASLGEGAWRVAGRAYDAIHQGDVLSLRRADGVAEADGPFVVREITTYGHAVPELPTMMTGALVVDGPAVSRIRPNDMFVRTAADTTS